MIQFYSEIQFNSNFSSRDFSHTLCCSAYFQGSAFLLDVLKNRVDPFCFHPLATKISCKVFCIQGDYFQKVVDSKRVV